jgi:DNA-binding transcriptional ArsR family regulator
MITLQTFLNPPVHGTPKVWRCRLAPAAKLLLVRLAYCANEKGACSQSLQEICRATDLAKSTVLRHLNLLEDAGYLWRKRGEDGSVTVYHLNLEVIRLMSGPSEKG